MMKGGDEGGGGRKVIWRGRLKQARFEGRKFADQGSNEGSNVCRNCSFFVSKVLSRLFRGITALRGQRS
jgi:hypothetical protein